MDNELARRGFGQRTPSARAPARVAGGPSLPAVVALLLLAGPAWAAERAAGRTVRQSDPAFRDLERVIATGDGRLVDLAASDGETIPDPEPTPLLDRLGADVACGTLVARAAERLLPTLTGQRAADAAALLLPPHLAAPRVDGSPVDGVFVHHDVSTASRHGVSRRDADDNRVADVVDAVIEDARFAQRHVHEALGAAPDALHLVLAESAHASGSALPRGWIVVPRQLQGEARLWALAHQVAHAAFEARGLAADLGDLPAGFEEAVTTYVADRVVAAAAGREVTPAEMLPERHANRSLLSPTLSGARTDAAFLHFTAGDLDLDSSWLGDVLDAAARRVDAARRAAGASTDGRAAWRDALVESLDDLLARRGSSLADAVAAHQIWTLEEELVLRGSATSVDSDCSIGPREEVGSGDSLPPFAQLRFGVDTPAAGGVRLALQCDERVEGHVVALLDDGTVRTFALEPGVQGRSLALPGSRLKRLVVLVHAPTIPADWSFWDGPLAAGGDAPGDFTLSIAPDESFPFALTALDAHVAPAQVTLEWGTSTEEDVAAWYVERAQRLAGPYLLLSPVPMPAESAGDRLASYAFVDPTVRPGTRYHYRVRAVTTSGLSEPTASLVVRTLPEGPR